MPVEVSCPCGMRSRGPDSLAGKQAKCPQCGNVLNIPHPQQAPVLLTPLEPRGPAPHQPIRPANSPLPQQPMRGPTPLGYPTQPQTNLAGLPTYDPLARPLSTQKPAESGGIPTGVWIGLACGAGGAVVAALIAIVVVSMSGGRPPVVPPDAVAAVNVPAPVAPPPTATVTAAPLVPATPYPTPSASPVQGPTTSNYSSPTTGPATVVGPTTPISTSPGSASTATEPPTSSPMTSPELASALASASGGSSVIDSSASRVPDSASDPPLVLLREGTDRWRASPRSNLRGMQRFPDKLHTYGYSWMVELLPYLGQEKVYARFDFSKSWAEGQNLPLTSAVIPAFINPADDRVRSKGYPFNGLGLTHFVGMAGVEDARNVVAGELPRSDPRAGVFGYDEVARPEAITDGQSQTILLVGSGNLPAPWVQGGGATVRGARAPYFDAITGFGSKGLASSGSQVLMADGSVRAVSASIDPSVFKAMCTIHGADSVDLQSVPFIPAETK